jgi:hypothetical protein
MDDYMNLLVALQAAEAKVTALRSLVAAGLFVVLVVVVISGTLVIQMNTYVSSQDELLRGCRTQLAEWKNLKNITKQEVVQ